MATMGEEHPFPMGISSEEDHSAALKQTVKNPEWYPGVREEYEELKQ
jgi:hypothetical protein